jgi:hypothetical protein
VGTACGPALIGVALAGGGGGGSGGGGKILLVPSTVGANGCSGPDQIFAPPQVPSSVALAIHNNSNTMHVTADAISETLFLTGPSGQVVSIDFSGGGAPNETELVAPGVLNALLGPLGIGAAQLSGIAVLDANTLLVVEQESNTIVAIDRNVPDTLWFFAGEPNQVGGFADGALANARFNFDRPTQICPTSDGVGGVGRVFVADPGNHAIREVSAGAVSTLAGSGAAGYLDGDIAVAGFDTPTGLTVRCSGTLLVTEEGASAGQGQRLRQVCLNTPGGGFVETLAGDGFAETTAGQGVLARLALPSSPLSTAEDDVYWLDVGTGVLRRMSGPLDTVDCPLWTNCAVAVAAGGNFTHGGVLSLTQTPGGVLYVLDAAAGSLLRVTP